MGKEFESARAEQTKQLIKDVFIDLYANRSIDSICIKEITDKAGLNRGTFYLHYQDIYDLLEEVEDELLTNLNSHISRLKDILTLDLNIAALKPLLVQALEYVRRRSKYFKALLGVNGSPSFLRKLKQIAKANFMDKLKQDTKLGEFGEYLIEYLVSAYVGIIVYWLESGMKATADELTYLISNVLLNGPLSFLDSRKQTT